MIDFQNFLNKIHPVDDQTLAAYLSHWRTYEAPRKCILTAPGQTERYLYFIQEGIQKSYYDNDGKQHIMFFAYPPSFSGVVESFFTQEPSRYFLETITASRLLRLPYAQHEALMREHREIETLFRKVAEQFLSGIIERHHELLTFNSETRLKNFMARSPHLLNMISQKDLASYLRIDPTNFSKMINQIKI
jgi:CRP-like cAMP-binding protein